MYKKKSIFVTFEGIEGSGKSFQSKKLFKNIKKIGINPILTREPGGSKSAEEIRKIILTGSKNKFSKVTDTLLYLAARNEHIEKLLKPSILKKKIIICDRFTDSTIAYQVHGKSVSRFLVKNIHNHILDKVKPDLTFVMKVSINKAFQRLKKRKHMNRYDKLSRSFYKKVQSSFISLAKKNKKRYVVLDNSDDSNKVEKIILARFLKLLNNDKKN